jgi:hypothetical protein
MPSLSSLPSALRNQTSGGLGAVRRRQHLFQHWRHKPAQFGEMGQPPLAPNEQTAQLILQLLQRARERG